MGWTRTGSRATGSQGMCKGIDESTHVVVCLTRQYMAKVGSDDARDNCRKEFQYAETVKGGGGMIAVVMEPELLRTQRWNGPVAMVLANKIYVDFSSDDKLEEAVLAIRRAQRGSVAVSMPARPKLAAPAHRKAPVHPTIRARVERVRQEMDYPPELTARAVVDRTILSLG